MLLVVSIFVEVALLITDLTGALCIGLFLGLNSSCKSHHYLLNPWFITQDQHLNFNHLYDALIHISPDLLLSNLLARILL